MKTASIINNLANDTSGSGQPNITQFMKPKPKITIGKSYNFNMLNPSPTSPSPEGSSKLIDESIKALQEKPAESKPVSDTPHIDLVSPSDNSRDPIRTAPINVTIPPNVDFGVEKLVNKEALKLMSDEGTDFFQKSSNPKKKISVKLNESKVAATTDGPVVGNSQGNATFGNNPEMGEDDGGEDDGGEDDGGEDDGGEDDGGEDDGGEDDGGEDDGGEDDGGEDDGGDDMGENGSEEMGMGIGSGGSEHNQGDSLFNLGGLDTDADAGHSLTVNLGEDGCPVHKLSRHERNILKRKELTLLERLDRKGFKPCKTFNMVDRLDEIVAERKRLDDFRGCEEAIKWQRKLLMGATTGIEYLNKAYDPFEVKLDGWSESIYENIGDYDEVFEELYHKYKEKVSIAPELKLAGMVIGSAMMFHFSKTLFSKASDQVPGFEDVMRENPELKAAYEQAAHKKMSMNAPSNSFMSNMIGNFFGNPALGNMVGGMMSAPTSSPAATHAPAPPSSPIPQQTNLNGNRVIPKIPSATVTVKTPSVEIDGPTGVDDLLKTLTTGTNAELTEMHLSETDGSALSDLSSNVKSVTFHNKRTTKGEGARKKVNLKLK
uniref:Uncharacterized protein n=1 Tax=viral metagenome TaxID=1070528 RepID=A0A6C0BJ91_9ZZZZ